MLLLIIIYKHAILWTRGNIVLGVGTIADRQLAASPSVRRLHIVKKVTFGAIIRRRFSTLTFWPCERFGTILSLCRKCHEIPPMQPATWPVGELSDGEMVFAWMMRVSRSVLTTAQSMEVRPVATWVVLPWTSVRRTASHVVLTYTFLSRKRQLTVYRRRRRRSENPHQQSGWLETSEAGWAGVWWRIAIHRHRWSRHASDWPLRLTRVNIARVGQLWSGHLPVDTRLIISM